jgi:glycosyltransferase involved in cell wall biosynthesis
MEAMACGVPVISGDLPAIRELVRHDDTGILVAGNQAQPLTHALERLAADGRLRQKLAESARRHVETEFSLRTTVDRLTRLLNDVTAQKQFNPGIAAENYASPLIP